MSAKKHKRKTVKAHSHKKKSVSSSSLLNRYPRLFFILGSFLVLLAIALLSIGYVSDARVGLSMIALFFGGTLVLLSRTALPKK